MGFLRKPLSLKNSLGPLIGFIVLCSLPEVVLWITQPAGWEFIGTTVNVDDLNVYLSAIRQGVEGKWLFTPQYSPETIPAHLVYFPYILMGKINKFLGGSTLFWYQLLRLFSTVFAVWALIQLLKTIYPDSKNLQSKAFSYLLFASGLGWLVLVITGTITHLTPDLNTPEWNFVTTYLSAPHFLLGLGFQTLVVISIITLEDSDANRGVYQLFVSGLGLGLTYPFLISVNGLILALWLLWKTLRERKVPWMQFILAGVGSLPMLLFLAFYGFILPQNPLYKVSLLNNNQISPPTPFGILFGFGLLLLFALIGIPRWIKSKHSSIIPLWILANIVALYLPFTFSGRFLLGLFIPVSIMAAFGLDKIVLQHLQRRRESRTSDKVDLSGIFFLLMIPSNIFILIFSLNAAKITIDFPYYFTESEKQALTWLAANTDDTDILLADYPISSLAPRFSPAKTFLGHMNLTIGLADKREMMQAFWDERTPSTKREDFLNQWGITYIYEGRFEEALSKGEVIPPGKIVYQAQDITIYSFTP